jgi:hypothetical protein
MERHSLKERQVVPNLLEVVFKLLQVVPTLLQVVPFE